MSTSPPSVSAEGLRRRGAPAEAAESTATAQQEGTSNIEESDITTKSKGKGKAKALWASLGPQAKAKAKAKAMAAKGKGKGKMQNLMPLLPGDVISLNRFDVPDTEASLSLLEVRGGLRKGYRIRDYEAAGALPLEAQVTCGSITLAVKDKANSLRIWKNGKVDGNGGMLGDWTKAMVVGDFLHEGATEGVGEISLYYLKSNLWLTIEPDGSWGSSSTRRPLRCRWHRRVKLAESPKPSITEGHVAAAEDGSKVGSELKEKGNEEEPQEDGDDGKETVEQEEEEASHVEDADDQEEPVPPPSHTFWKEKLKDTPILELKYAPLHPMDAYLSDDVHIVERRITIANTNYIIRQETQLLAAWAALLCRYGRADDIAVVAFTKAGPLPIRIPAPDQWTITQLSNVASANLNDAIDHFKGLGPFLASGEVYYSSMRFQVGFDLGSKTKVPLNSEQSVLQDKMLVPWKGAPENMRCRLDLQLRCMPTGEDDSWTVQLLHRVGTMNDEIATRALAHLEALLSADGPCSVSEMCSEEEHTLLLQWSDASDERYKECERNCVHEAFEARAIKSPNAVALIDEGRNMTYAQLAVAAADVAAKLVKEGVQPDALVPLMSDRSLEMIVAIFGILMAEGGYVPLDSKWPDDRVADVAEQCASRAACAGPGYFDRLRGIFGKTPVIDVKNPDAISRDAAAKSVKRSLGRSMGGSGVVYTFFTSGSTGKPKGVVVEHKGLVHRVQWFQERWQMEPKERGILKHSYTFGLSEWEIFWPLSVHGTVVLCKPGGEKDMEYLWQLTEKHKIRTQVFVPSVLRALLEYAELELEEKAGKLWPRLKAAITCGEPLTAQLSHQFADLIPHATLDNLYGPTEGEMTVWRVPQGEILQTIPIGIPMGGSRVLLTTSADGLAGVGEPGEINFGGTFIARGYLGLPELTSQKFVPDPFEGGGDCRMYQTGDLARWRESGILDFLGRADFQVKLRGFRIELGEIEEALRAAGAKTVVCVVAGEAPLQRLVAYATPEDLNADALRRSCAGRLPPYMVPSQVVLLDALPRTASGKIDRKSLPPPPEHSGGDDGGDEGTSAIVEPRNALEKQIREVWAEVLGKTPDCLSVEADWPLVGGNSLLAGKATSMLRKQLDVQFPGTAMYTNSTIAKLAELALKLGADPSGDQKAAKADVSSSKDIGPKPPEERYKALDPRRPDALLIQFGIMVFGNMVGDSGALALRVALAWGVYDRFGFYAFAAALPSVLVVALLVEAMFCIACKNIFIGKLEAGRYPLWGNVYFRWLLNRHLVEKIRDRVSELVASTCLLSVFYRLLGAKIGKRVELSDPELEEPDLVEIGDDVEVHHARLSTSAILDGELILGRIVIGDKCRMLPRSMAVHGTELPPGSQVQPLASTVGWMGAVGSVCQLEKSEIETVMTQDFLRLFIGIPILLALHSLPAIIVVKWLEWFWLLCAKRQWLFWLFAPILWRHGYALLFFALTVLQKRAIVGKILPGPKLEEGSRAWHWDAFRIWLHEQAICARAFDDAMDPFVGGEVLSVMYRMLGTKVGRRVQIDNFHCAEHDCVEIDDDVVFGSAVSIHCSGAKGRELVRLHRGSNLLDHGVVMAGACIGERAVLGSASLAPEHGYFPPESVSTGQIGGRPVRLRFQAAAEGTAETEKEAMRRLNDDRWFWGFNIGLALSAIVCSPVPLYELLATYLLWVRLFSGFPTLLGLLVLPFVFFAVRMGTLVLNYVLKWSIIGSYKEGDYTFFGVFHISWMVMMILAGVMEDVMDAMQGTEYLMWYYRVMGAKVGKNCALFGLAFEYDLLTVGDNSSICWECDTTCHTVENMVIKLAPTILEPYTSMLPHSMVSPGASVGRGAAILENSQVLKGEQVPANEMWAGLPASSFGWVKEPGGQSAEAPPEAFVEAPVEVGDADPAQVGAGDDGEEVDDRKRLVKPKETMPPPAVSFKPKVGLQALEAKAVVSMPDLQGGQNFLVEQLWNGNLCFWHVAEDTNELLDHLRMKRNGGVDFKGRRGPLSQFQASNPFPKVKDPELVELRNVVSGHWLSEDAEKPSSPEPRLLRVQQVQPPGAVSMNLTATVARKTEEANLFQLTRRQSAAYAVQSASAE